MSRYSELASFVYAVLTSLRHEVTEISRISKWWERSRLNMGGDNSEEWLEGGGDEEGDLF